MNHVDSVTQLRLVIEALIHGTQDRKNSGNSYPRHPRRKHPHLTPLDPIPV